MSSCQLPNGTTSLPGNLVPMIGWLIAAPLLTGSWTRDNNGPALAPEADDRVQWVSDADFRGLDRAEGTTYASSDGRTTYAAGPAWEHTRPYDTTTPDGRWHLMVVARGALPRVLRGFALGMVVVPLVPGFVGLKQGFSGQAGGGKPRGTASPTDF